MIINKNIRNITKRLWECIPCRILTIVIGFILGLFIATLLIVNPVLNTFVKPKIVEAVNTNENYYLTIDDMGYHLFGNTLSANNIEYKWVSTSKTSVDSSILFIPECNIKGISLFELVFGIRLSFSELDIENPELLTIQKKGSNNNTDTTEAEQKDLNEIYNYVARMFPDRLKPVKINTIVIESGTYKKINSASENVLLDSIKTLNLSIENFKIDDNKKTDSLALMFCESIEIEAENIIKYFRESGYLFTIDKFSITSDDSSAKINSLNVSSYLSEKDFFARKQFRSDMWQIKIPDISLSGINFTEFVWHEYLKVHNVNLDADNLTILTDNRLLPDPASDPKMPHEIIAELSFELNIRNVFLKMDSIVVQNRLPYTNQPSRLSFTGVNGTIKNISNIPSLQSYESPAEIIASACIARNGLVKLKMELPLLADGIDFNYGGSMGQMDLLTLNEHLIIFDLVKLTSGKADSVFFEAKSNNGIVSVNTTPFYHDLRVESINEETMKNTGIMAAIETFIGNTFKIRKNNPDDSGKTETGIITYEKKEKDAFLDIVWEALRAGLGDVVGF